MGQSARDWAQSGQVAWWPQGANTAVGSASNADDALGDLYIDRNNLFLCGAEGVGNEGGEGG